MMDGAYHCGRHGGLVVEEPLREINLGFLEWPVVAAFRCEHQVDVRSSETT